MSQFWYRAATYRLGLKQETTHLRDDKVAVVMRRIDADALLTGMHDPKFPMMTRLLKISSAVHSKQDRSPTVKADYIKYMIHHVCVILK